MRPMACPPLRWPSWCAGCWNPAARPGGYQAGKAGERAGLLAKRLLPFRAFQAAAKSSLGV